MAIGNYVTSTMGMHAQAHALEQISSNIANVNTVGYKKVNARFETQMSGYNEHLLHPRGRFSSHGGHSRGV